MLAMLQKKLTNSGNIKKGQILNPGGRPKGALGKKLQIKERLLGKWKTHPADRLVKLANAMEEHGNFEDAAKIWENLLKYFEPAKKPVETKPEPATPEESAEAAEETYKLLQELEQNGLDKIKGSKGHGVASGKADVPPKASPKTDLPGHKKE